MLSLLDLVTFALITAPLLIAFGLKGFAGGMLLSEAISLAGRTYYLGKIFPAFVIVKQAFRAVAPVVPAVAVVVLARVVESGPRTAAMAVVELVAFGAVTLAWTAVLERSLLREVFGYLRRHSDSAPARPRPRPAPAQRGASA